ncbi:GDYXXLXY domain-containing protein [Serratia rubidaea]|uniref:GDYXXLXY domain-containing protein n=1 Tax=Serratia rubidaea TaxID=61652 RepID=UPI0022B8D88E|nr:GDYXXLXY domain-containing protein [Serratia rubidaea]WBF43811.1 GDYXXLXY domain-containing protein [Serratia rubidaea]
MQTNSVIKWLTGALVLAALLLVNLSIYQKEQQLRQGRVAILQLAPVDPRSLMQGDYMALDYALAAPLRTQMRQQRQACRAGGCQAPASRGQLVIELDAQQHAVSARFYRGEPLKPQQMLMQYHLSASGLQIGTPSYFFQEGHGDRFARARYGEFRVAQDGSALLTYLRDADDRRILP